MTASGFLNAYLGAKGGFLAHDTEGPRDRRIQWIPKMLHDPKYLMPWKHKASRCNFDKHTSFCGGGRDGAALCPSMTHFIAWPVLVEESEKESSMFAPPTLTQKCRDA